MGKGKPLAALIFAAVLGVSASQFKQCLAADGSAGSGQAGGQTPAPGDSQSSLTTLDVFKQSTLVRSGAWPGVGPFQGGDKGEFTDASQNRLVLELDRDRIKSAQMSVSDQPKSLVKLQIAADFLLESLGAQAGKISDFNAQLKKCRTELTSSSSNKPLSLTAGRYLVFIHPESAHRDQVSFIIRINSKADDVAGAASATPPPVKTPVATATAVVAGTNNDTTSDSTTDGATGGHSNSTDTGSSGVAARDTAGTTAAGTGSDTAPKPGPAADTTEPTHHRSGKKKSNDITMVAKTPPDDLAPKPELRPVPTLTKPAATATALLPVPPVVVPIHPASQTNENETAYPQPDSADLRIEFTRLINNWQQVKRSALLDRDPSSLPQSLGGKALNTLNDLIKKLAADHRHYDVTPKSSSLDHFTEVTKGSKYSVYAQISENSKIIDDNTHEVMKDTTNSYGVNYTVERVGDRWLIVDSSVVSSPQPPANAQVPPGKSQGEADSAKQDVANGKAQAQTAAKTPGKVSR